MNDTTVELVDVSPEMLEQWLEGDDALLVDVREDFEHAAERIDGATHVALSRLSPDELRAAHGDARLVFYCRSGVRSATAAAQCADGDERAFHLAGGIEAWKASGRSTVRSVAAPQLDVMRQVQITAGMLVLTGVILGTTVSPWFLAISGFVGAGLTFAGASGWCGMAKLLARMPWNRVAPG